MANINFDNVSKTIDSPFRQRGEPPVRAPPSRVRLTGFRQGSAMPLIHISLRAGKPEAYRQAIFDSLYRAMRDTLDVPEDDQFMTITEHDAANFRYSASCYGVSRSEDVVYIQITVFDTRTAEQKKALFRRTAELLGENPGIRPENVFVNVLESAKENWSVGHGLAQFA
jgi:phenylpyruvate tautomerase PptA (4-oxalocrotonate tautomerase family)